MKQGKKLLSFVLSLALLCNVFAITVFTASAQEGDGTDAAVVLGINLESSNVEVGQTIKAHVTIGACEDLLGLTIRLLYDENILEVVSFTDGDALTGGTQGAGQSGIYSAAKFDGYTTQGGTLYTMEFKTKEVGETTLSLAAHEGGIPSDINGEELPTVWGEASFTVTVSTSESIAYDGQTTPGNYTISTAQQLAQLAAAVNVGTSYSGSRFTQQNDIDLAEVCAPEAGSWPSIGNGSSTPFRGEFDGAGYNISNLYLKADSMYNGLFGNVGKGGLVHNVTIASGELTASKACLGGVAGYLQDGTVDNCVNYATIRSTVESTNSAHSYCGGIVGEMYNLTTQTVVSNCVNYGAVTGSAGSIGGIVGLAFSGLQVNLPEEEAVGSTLIRNCANHGLVTQTDESQQMNLVRGVAGILGSGQRRLYIENCVNTGKIVAMAYGYAGGIAGEINLLLIEGRIENCYNTGDVEATTIGGGLGGSISGSGTNAFLFIDNCYNTGSVTGLGDSLNAYMGGLIASCSYYTYLSSCYSTGVVTPYNDYSTMIGRTGALFGHCGSTQNVLTSVYALEGAGPTVVGTASVAAGRLDGASFVTEDQLKSMAPLLGDAYATDSASLNNGYPVLVAQLAESGEGMIIISADTEVGAQVELTGIAPEETQTLGRLLNLTYDAEKAWWTGVDVTSAVVLRDGTYYITLTEQMKGKTDYLFSADLSLSAQTVMDLIDQIGEVTVGSRAAIDRAIETYETLPAYVKGQVTNADKLSDAKAAYVAAVIDSIGAITPESGAAISDARNFYDTKLTAQEQEKVGNYDTLVTAEAVYNVVKQIADIGEVTTDSYWDIYYAKQAYNKLSETQKALVTNYEDISKAEVAYVVALIDSLSTLDPINSQSKINSAKTRYNALSEEQKQQVYNYGDISKAEIARVEALIRRIGEVTIQSKNYITQAKTAFNALTAEQQALVSNAADISQAEIAYVEARIADIGEVTVDSSSKISLARNEYNALEETQQQKVGNSNTLIEAEVDYVEALIDHIGEVTVSSKGDITRAITAYDALTETQQALVSNAADISKAQIAYVEALIAAIGTVSVDSEAQILEAKAEYQALTEAQQGQVGNYDEVIQAQVDYVIACIDSLDQFGASSKAQLAIDKAKTDYAALTEAQQALVSNYEKIAQAEDQLPEVLAQVVSIAGAEEFAAFAARVNDGEDLLNGCLTADIDLSETVWIPIGNTADTAYAGTFDGNGYAVSGFHFTSTASYQGLFGRINTGGVVKNLTVASGEIKANHGNFGVIAGQNKGRIENCANYANITYTSAYNGGIAGQNGGEIARCFNAGSLSTTGTPSANGGIAGSNNSKCTIIDCYNVGNINGGQWEMYNGGVVGFANGPVINCYNTGTVKGYQCAQIASSGSAGMLQNCVGLDGNGKLTGDFQTSDEAQAKLVTAQELKELAAAMGDAFTSDEAINDGYPILRWQVAEKDVLVLIDAIGEVTLSSSEEIKAARTAYDALPAAFQAKVTNYSTLCDAESTYSALVAAEELATAKNTAKSQLDTYKDASNYRDEQKAELTAAIEAGKRKIDEAADLEGVSIALANAKAVMDGIKTDAQLSEEAAAALAKAKEDAKTELEGYKNAEAYRPEQQTELESAIAAGKQAIDEAADLESVSKALTDAKSAMDGIKTDAQLTEEETAAALASAKDDAKTELEGYKNAEAYRPEQQTELESAIAAGKQAIDEAADLESVSKALTDAKAVLDGVKTDAQLRQDDISQLNDLIEAIGEVNEMNSAEALVKIEAAERALAALKAQYGDAVLEEVDNIDKLLEARQKYDELNPVVRLGDINGDGKIDAVDALLALQHSVQLSVLEGDKLTAADVNRDGRVDASDALLMLQHSVGLITEFPNAQ